MTQKANIMKHLHWFFLSSLALLLALGGLGGCQTYEDGPLLSLRSKRARVVNNWQPYLISRNDLDERAEYTRFELDFTDGGEFSWRSQTIDGDTTALDGTWELSSANRQIKLTYLVPADSVSVKERLLYMDILRLKEDDLWLDYFHEGDYHSLRLSPR